MKLYIAILILFVFFKANAQEKTFAITRKTPFFNEKGEKLSFEDFTLLTSKYKSSLLPTFDNNNALEYIVIRYPQEAEKYVGPNRQKVIEKEAPILTQEQKYKNNFNTTFTDIDSYSNVKDLVGMIAPSFSIEDQYGQTINSDSLKGNVVVLKFWFSSCTPCVEEMPSLNMLVNDFKYKNVKFYAPSVEKKERSINFLNHTAFNYDVFYEAQDLAALYKTPGYPTHVVIGKDGRIRKVIVGKRTNIYKILKEEVKKALLVEKDDLDVVEIDDNESFILNDYTIILNENGDRIKKEEYIYRLNTGRYKVYKKIKKNGNINLLITNKN